MARIPDYTKVDLTQRLNIHARAQWHQINKMTLRFRGSFAYVSVHLADGSDIPLMRLRYTGSTHTWGFAIYRASHNDFEDSRLPDGQSAGSPILALDTAAALYLTGPTD